MKTRKLFAMLLAASLIASLASCGNSGDTSSTGSSDSDSQDLFFRKRQLDC